MRGLHVSKNVEAEEENLSGNLVLLITILCNIISFHTMKIEPVFIRKLV